MIAATEEECRATYKGHVSVANNLEPAAEKVLIWQNGDDEVLVGFISGKANYIVYMKKKGAFSEQDITRMLKLNSSTSSWTALEKPGLRPGWVRADRKVFITYVERLRAYTVSTKEWMDLLQSRKKG